MREVAVRLEIYDMMGRKVAVLTPGAPGGAKLQPGWHQVSWDGRNLAGIPVASGMYIYRLVAGNFRQTRKMLLVK